MLSGKTTKTAPMKAKSAKTTSAPIQRPSVLTSALTAARSAVQTLGITKCAAIMIRTPAWNGLMIIPAQAGNPALMEAVFPAAQTSALTAARKNVLATDTAFAEITILILA